MSKIIVSMSGWCEADPDRVRFQYIGPDDNDEQYITGTEWLSLDEEAREDYHEAALEAYKLYMDAYFTALSRLEAEEEVIEGNKAGIDAFIDILYEEDFAATAGKLLFGSDFDTYFLDGFWRDGYYGPGL